jgi:hypothetical protein
MLALKLPVQRPIRIRKPNQKTKCYQFQNEIEYVGKTLTLFVLFTSTMNWWFYRKITKKKDKE